MAACPTEVFELQHGSDGALQRRIARILQRHPSVTFVCSAAPARLRRGENVVAVPCLARVPSAELVPPLLERRLAAVRVVACEACAGCRAREAMEVKIGELRRLRSLLATADPFGRRSGRIELYAPGEAPPEPITARNRQGHGIGAALRRRHAAALEEPAGASGSRAFDHGRRELLSAARTLPAHSGFVRLIFGLELPRNRPARPPRNGALRGHLPRRERRRQADRALREAGFPAFFYPTVPRAQVGEACTLCNACSTICPAGALSRGHEDTVEYLEHEPPACIACRLCVDLCPPQAIKLTVASRDAGPVRVFSRGERVCSRCGRRFFARAAEDRCRACSGNQPVLGRPSTLGEGGGGPDWCAE